MSTITAQLLQAFEKLPEQEREEFVQEILKRVKLPNASLLSKGIDPVRAADLRNRLKTFAEDWERPEMDIYDENPSR